MKQFNNIDIEQDVELTTIVMPAREGAKPFEFKITGDYETVKPYADEAIAYDKAHPIKTPVLPKQVTKVGSAVIESVSNGVQRSVGTFALNLKNELRVSAFDVVNGTNLRAELHRQRRIRRITDFAGELGILDVEPCAKHRKAMEKAKKLA